MKHKLFIISLSVATFLASCSNSKEKNLIADFEQTIEDTKIDLNLKVISIEKKGDVFAKDSLEILKDYFEKEKQKKITFIEETIQEYKIQIDSLVQNISEYEEIIELAKFSKQFDLRYYSNKLDSDKEVLKFANENLAIYLEAIESYRTTCEGTFLEPTFKSIKMFEKNPDSLLFSKHLVTYSIINPIPNNAKQEITKIYHINESKTKVVGTESVK
jgi:hypothetical protein